ncbi:MAG: hypothetical protein PVJ06_10735, partial [Desulfobacterales bacterium]
GSPTGIARYVEDRKRARTPPGPKDAVYGWTLPKQCDPATRFYSCDCFNKIGRKHLSINR